MIRYAWVLVGFVGLQLSAAAGENWPQFRGPRGDGHSLAATAPVHWSETNNIAWKTAIHDRGWSSPVLWDGHAWMTTATADGRAMFAVCVDLADGRIAHDVKLFDIAEPQHCHAMNSYASPTPVVEAGRVYLHFGSYGTACLDTRTAAVLWTRRDLPCDHFRGPGSSPILYDGKLIVHFDGFDHQYVVALDKSTGQTVWRVDRKVEYGTDNGDIYKAYCTPLVIQVDGRPQLVSPTSKATIAYDPETGEEIWRVRYRGFSATARPLFGHGLVFLNTGFPKADLLAVRPGSGDLTDKIVWTVTKNVGSKPSQLLVDDLIYNVSDNGVASCIDAVTGEAVWSERLGGPFSASPIYAGGQIYFFDHDGRATVIRPGREYRQLAVNTLDAGCLASPAVWEDGLIVRTQTHLYRIGAPQ